MPNIAKIVVDIATKREFDYLIPDELKDSISIGTKVIVPFGKRNVSGYVVELPTSSEHKTLKSVISLESSRSMINESMLKLVRWMADYYNASTEQALRTVLPGAVRRKGSKHKQILFASLQPTNTDAKISPKQQSVLDILASEGDLPLNALAEKLNITTAPIRALQKKGLLNIAPRTSQRNPLANKTIIPTHSLTLMPEQTNALDSIILSLTQHTPVEQSIPPEKSSSGRQHAVPPTKTCDISSDLGGSAFCRPSCSQLSQKNQQYSQAPSPTPVTPTPHTILLYGVTGSGKTEVYMQAIDYVVKNGGGAIVLVPEISLTPQTVERFTGRFGDRIAVLHSHLSEGERHDEWHRIHTGKATIVIGARSAVFAPVNNLRLIIVDEEHEPSYKQEEAPRYNARDVAVMRGHIENCTVVLGSATPSLESWYNTKKGKYTLSVLHRRADNRSMPVMRIVDMRIETERTGHVSVFSRDLAEAVKLRLDRAEQTILFLNRRGFATSLICPHCGYVANCDQCSVSYTYHRNDNKLRCHICGSERHVPGKCPSCQDPSFKFAGIGTQRLERIIGKFFPHASVQRIDTDTTNTKDAYDRILGDFRVGKTDILIGTQMIAKGLHFPNVTLVGIVHADLSLHMPDFRASERTFQLLAQVAGRAGRGEIHGEVIVQTYTPHHVAIQAARRLDYEGFCDQELEFRKELSYPPFSRLICITVRGRSEDKVSFCATTLAGKLRKAVGNKAMISEAVPAPLARAKGLYRYQIMIRTPAIKTTTASLNKILSDLKPPQGVIITTDVDAISLL